MDMGHCLLRKTEAADASRTDRIMALVLHRFLAIRPCFLGPASMQHPTEASRWWWAKGAEGGPLKFHHTTMTYNCQQRGYLGYSSRQAQGALSTDRTASDRTNFCKKRDSILVQTRCSLFMSHIGLLRHPNTPDPLKCASDIPSVVLFAIRQCLEGTGHARGRALAPAGISEFILRPTRHAARCTPYIACKVFN